MNCRTCGEALHDVWVMFCGLTRCYVCLEEERVAIELASRRVEETQLSQRDHSDTGPHCCDLASDGLACDCADNLADELEEECLGCGRRWTGAGPVRDYCDECLDAQYEAKNADELDEYMNDLCNRRNNA